MPQESTERSSFDLETVYVQLLGGPEVTRVEVRPELHEGRLVAVFPYTEDRLGMPNRGRR